MDPQPGSIELTGAWIARSPTRAQRGRLEISDGRIQSIAWGDCRLGTSPTCRWQIRLDGHLILPGLINAHDHLEFNLFPRLGRGPYRNATEWARDVYHPDRSPVREQLDVPKDVRLWWGGLKNLLSGVTTVCHHNPYESTFDSRFPVRVVRRYGWSHSLAFGSDLGGAHRATGAGEPFVIHLAEGTDRRSADELFALDRLGVLDHRTVLVHGVGLTGEGHALRQERGAALVWCPTSNHFTLGTTLNPGSNPIATRIALGSDSAITGRGTLLDEIRFASHAHVPAGSIYDMVTGSASDVLRLGNGEGKIEVGGFADLVAIPWTEGGHKTPAEALTQMDSSTVEMVMVSGQAQLVSPEAATRWPEPLLDGLEPISIDGARRQVRAPVRRLLGEAQRHLGREIRLAGKRVSA